MISELDSGPESGALLPLDHPTYLRRLARALNEHSFNGFYAKCQRWNQARFHRGRLQVQMCRDGWVTTDESWVFWDPYGGDIVVSRHPRK